MGIKIALAGNPNCGKTTLFNALTGSNQFVGNWPGVTVEKKEGKLKKHNDVIIMDLPGIYSLSPYTLEEVVARNYLIKERPDAILNIIDGTNLERNLYLTTQLTELGIPVVVAINMMDVINKNGDKINVGELSRQLGCKVVEISALKGTGIMEAAEATIEAAKSTKTVPMHSFNGVVEHALAHIEEAAVHNMPAEQQRWYAIKIFERDEKVLAQLNLDKSVFSHIEQDIKAAEAELDDDSESIITNERYIYIASILKGCYKKKNAGKLSTSDKIDKVVTNRWAALPIFGTIMFIVYFLSITTVGTWATNWVNDGLFSDGWRLLGVGSSAYEQAVEEYAEPGAIKSAFESAAKDSGLQADKAKDLTTTAYIYDDDGKVEEKIPVTYEKYMSVAAMEEPEPASYGVWVPGIPKLLGDWLESINCADWLQGLILNGIVAGVGSVLGFVPQMLVLFLLLAFLEACGYMARIAFVMDRIFRKFGLSGKSFIPMLIGTGCGVPGIMASRTIENDRDRKMTIITTTFIPCGAKLPIIALIAGALFGGAWWVAPSAYFVGIAAIIFSGIMLKKMTMFRGDPAPFVMELPAYHLPTVGNLLRSMWERGWSFIKKAGTIILLATIFVWFTSNFGWKNGSFGMVDMNKSILAAIGSAIAWIFKPLGWGHWQGAVASITGLIAKENVVGTFGVLFGGFDEVAENGWQIWTNMREVFTPLAAYSFLVFNLLCAPCFAAIGAIKREMNSAKWTFFAISYQCVFAYVVSLIIYQLGTLFTGHGSIIGAIAAFILVTLMLYMLLKPYKDPNTLKNKANIRA
ncbi:ferrous iron transport protein B [Ruminiclostridium papyrosolvens DSM 2782]|uniref:Ferrous iron transport protein B n=1 Tax=Ruminiclostridium papyrosolvens DSM 2782 TaxID=588581 RepID=F1T951_9FIRM|nr:ferrous iron transport protein B [Ruminiclostridium papyrosolvens]EGD49033.1 ferrous iron transport protein B [Ruminiclostridium papyrosolvens DSM 2782]WES35515.1 ferrous iron transport protein B [Ruminiclostridium papyrosolvens DSM 2782]